MQYLLEIHIGPVQEFVAAARRTRDLWFGSWLLSELSKAAARGVTGQHHDNRLIFPAPGSNLSPESELNVSNKITALVINPAEAAKNAEDVLQQRYNNLIAEASLQSKLTTAAWQRAEKQLHSFLEFYWVSYPLNDDYPRARTYADALFAARKNSRTFKSVDWIGQGLPKSSLDGRMETVTPQKAKKQTEAHYAKQMYSQFRARPGEQLSGVDLLKRLGMLEDDKSRFPSTSHMAAMPLRAQLQAKAGDPVMQGKWDAYITALTTINPEIEKQEIVYHDLNLPILDEFDGSLLFESRLLDFMDKSETAVPKQKLKAFLNAADLSDPNPYYVLLVGDGDAIGAAINKMETDFEHSTFSQKLAEFSEVVKKIVAEQDGAVVYAGGDDVLALLPLHTAVMTTATLAATFRDMLGGDLTFSAGLAIVHHLEPLEDALDLARKAENKAKAFTQTEADGTESNKNALAITLNKRSGIPRTIVGRWGEIDARLDQFATYFKNKNLPHGLAYQLRDMFLHLGGQSAVRVDVKKNGVLQDVLAAEAERIIKRKDGDEKAASYVAREVQKLDHKKTTIETLSSELIIAGHIAQAQSLADRQSEEPT